MNMTAIVVVAYNRPESLRRLLDSLTNAYYPEGVDVPLIISVDKSDSSAVEDVAKDYVWEHGEKILRFHEENLGLKCHVLECGDIAKDYDGVIILEDDLYVSPSFYMYTLAAFSATRMEGRIGGISLYSHRLNVHAREPFEAIDDGYDNYYMQFASSWGQAFTAAQWEGFRKWMDENGDKPVAAGNVPLNVSSWSEKSWLKYYIKYLIDTGRYFLYPRVSFTTNFGDEGEHMKDRGAGLNDLQVPIAGIRKYGQIDFHFADIDESGAVYDAYFENMRLEHRLTEAVRGEVTVDLYGVKQPECCKRYVLSGKALSFRILESFGRRLRPVDANVLYKIGGKDFFLYDTDKPGRAPKAGEVRKYLYNYRALKASEMMKVLGFRIKSRLIPAPKAKKSGAVKLQAGKGLSKPAAGTENGKSADSRVTGAENKDTEAVNMNVNEAAGDMAEAEENGRA
ncbi:MAG: glycosyltransferase [Lachnospiraceae bacterium]|nr:glycosyltransferase [Lachnospiraceae bacterium]